MKVLVTGLNGTLAPKLAALLRHQGHEVLAWQRDMLDVNNEAAGRDWLDAQGVQAVAHLAMGDAHWAGWMAWWAAQRGLPFVFTSTAMVFHHEPDGPHQVGDATTAQDDYGRGKALCEQAVLQAHPHAVVARIGWQIDLTATGNNMLRALDDWQARDGRIGASTLWRPACSFMDDTVAALAQCLRLDGASPSPHTPAGLIHLDSNAQDGWNFAQVAEALGKAAGRGWQVVPEAGYAHDQRLMPGVGQGVVLPGLKGKLVRLKRL